LSKDAYYFPHDSNARQDVKILKLRIKHGWAGYGLYWGIIETLRDQDNYAFEADQPELISLAVGCSIDEITPVLNTCLEVGLLKKEDGYIFSPSLKRRMERVDDIREKRRLAGKKRAEQMQEETKEETEDKTEESNDEQEVSTCLAYAQQMLNTCSANENQMLSIKEKKIKENEIKEKDNNKIHAQAQALAGASTQKAQRTKFVKDLFENQFWKLYPRKRAKQDALKAFMTLFPPSASKEQCNRRWKNIVLHIDALVAEGRPPDKIPYPATFLRRENFDEPPAEITISNVPEMEFVEVGSEDEN
jgi:hypothetical protein